MRRLADTNFTVDLSAGILESAMRMSGRSVAGLVAAAVACVVVAGTLIFNAQRASLTLTGVVLRKDSDPKKQLPIPNVKVTATEGTRSVQGDSDTSGLFRLKLTNGGWRDQPVMLAFQHPDYHAIEVAPEMKGELYVVRMTPKSGQTTAPVSIPEIVVKDVRVRYAEKTSSPVDVGSTANTFTVVNKANVPCERKLPCSPDGKWKASLGGITMDAGEGQQFENARVSCIAGPCPFTRIESGIVPHPGRMIKVSVLNWSDTTTFLVEAEVTRGTPSDAIRQAYPAIYGRSMSFTLPATASGPSVEADLGGNEIVFPLGPELRLSWAACTQLVGADKTKLYRCELKQGYEFR